MEPVVVAIDAKSKPIGVSSAPTWSLGYEAEARSRPSNRKKFHEHHNHERIAARDVVHDVPALVVDRPHVERLQRHDERRCTRLSAIATTARAHDSSSLQDQVDRAARGPLFGGTIAIEDRENLLRAPRRTGLPHSKDVGLDAGDRLIRMRPRRSRSVVKTVRLLERVPREELVARRAADAELLAQLGHRLLAAKRGCNELQALAHGAVPPSHQLV